MVTELEFPVCPLCSSDGRSVVYTAMHDILYGLPGTFTIVRCLDCGLLYLYPRPNEQRIVDYYPTHYGPFTGSESSAGAPSQRHAILRSMIRLPYRLRFGSETTTLTPFGQRRMLDIGCGGGGYLQTMQRLGWDVYGVDASDVAVQSASGRVGASRVQVGTIETLDPLLDELDLITINHVLEHLPDPRAALTEVHRRLATNGKLRIIVPDVSGLEARLLGRYWLGLDVPRHLVDFSKRTLYKLLQESGFCIESCRPEYFPRLPAASFNLALELGLHVRWRGVRDKLTILMFVLSTISYAFGNRGTIEVIAQKEDRNSDGRAIPTA